MSVLESTDAELLHRYAAGDDEAFAQLVRRHKDRLWAVALRTMRNPEEAADALQEALISAASPRYCRARRRPHVAAPDRHQRVPRPAAAEQGARVGPAA